MTVTIGVEPAELAAGESFVLAVEVRGDLDVTFGKAMRMRPADGSDEFKDAHTYWLVGSRHPDKNQPRYFGPGEPLKTTDEGYLPATRLTFRVPPVALAQRYRLTLALHVREQPDAPHTKRVAETPLRVV